MVKMCMRLAVLLCSLAYGGSAFAEGFALYEYSARGIALGGAMVGRKPDASAMAYNPALMTKLEGAHVMAGVSTISPRGRVRYLVDEEYERTALKPSTWLVPHLYYTQQLSDDWYLGIGQFSRFGLGFEYPHNWPGRFNIYEVSLTSTSFNTNLAWAATDKLSLSAGLELVYVNLDLKKRKEVSLGQVIPGASFEVDSDIQGAKDIAPGFSLAGHYQFNDEWAAGLVYRSQVRVHAKGDVSFSYMGSSGVPSQYESAVQGLYGSNFSDGGVHATVILPDSVAAGVSYSPIPDLSIEVGAIWTRWSTFRGLNIHLPDPMEANNNPKHWKDSWRLNVGAEYDLCDWLTVRAGYVYDQSPMTDQYSDYLVPTDGRNIYSTGIGLKWNSWTLDAAYAYIDAKGRSYKASSDTNVGKSKITSSTSNIFSVSLGYEF